MPVPTPPVALENACSVIFDNSLYVYQPGAFQRLRLAEGAKWETLSTGEVVTGGVCVGSTPKDASKAGLYIVGGKGTTPGYEGLQKFTYSTGKWETIKPVTPVTQDRTWHGATYINSTDAILVYAGNQDGSQHLSSQTFTIQASAPYGVLAFQSTAPPTISPILMQWSETQAVMVGGGEANTKVMLFSPETSWQDSGATLADPIPKTVSAMRAVLMKGDDGCKNLYTFDMTQSPNQVNRIVLLDAAGKPVVNSATIKARSDDAQEVREWDSKKERRELTLDHWPSYNATLAPKSTRTNYAVAQDPNGLVVFSGGNKDDVLCMFDARSNSWQNASTKLAEQKVLVASIPVTSLLASSTASATISTTPTAAAIGSGSNSNNNTIDGLTPNALLGIVLGAIVAAIIVLGLILFFVRRHRSRQNYLEAGHARRASGSPSDEKDVFAFAKDSLPPGPGGHFRSHQPSDSQGSYSSMAILMGRVGQQNKSLSRKPSNESRRTSTSSMFNKQFKSTISKPLPQLADHPALQQSREEKGVSFAPNLSEPRPQPRENIMLRQGSTRRSSGWNRYWSGGSALNLLGFGASKRTTVDSDQSSRYSNNNRITQDSATVPPLTLNFEGREKLSRVHSGSPTISQYPNKIPLKEGMAGKIERPMSQESLSGYSSGIPASVHDTWDPAVTKKPWGADRAPSIAYNSSYYPTTSLAPSSTSSRPPANGLSRQPQLAMATTSSDMSWLNLGDYARR
jgi:hypothetical protein